MHAHPQAADDEQPRLISALREGRCYPHAVKNVRLLETHISWVLLAGRYAYKIKKPVNLGFLDFSTLAARQFFCAEEIRLNRRLAPQLYLDVIAIGGTPDAPVMGAEPALEYAVRMRRFAVSRQLDRLLLRGALLPQHLDNLAVTIARFHHSLPAADRASTYGSPAAIGTAAMENFAHLLDLLGDPADQQAVGALQEASKSEFAACDRLFAQRREQGHVRECHGDLHLGNIVLLGGEAVPFDGIEFNPALRWIDVISEIAFTVMDLQQHQRHDLASRFLNAWLQESGDYSAVAVLRFYIAYRAAVRAKVCAIRAAQEQQGKRARSQALAACRGYLALAAQSLWREPPVLIITHGLPGSGKTTFSQAALERLGAIRIRSDVERKRLHGLSPLAASAGAEVYGADATRRTYARLLELAGVLLKAGYTVIVDAAFLKQDERRQFSQLAQELAVPFAIASLQAGDNTLKSRISQRMQAGNDASEAGLDVLQLLQEKQELLSQQERQRTVVFLNEETGLIEGTSLAESAWAALERLLQAGT